MKLIAKFAVAAALASVAVTANAWWGWGGPGWGGYPGWGYPGWGYGYAPVYAVPAYGYAPVAPWGNPFANDPVFGDMEDFSKAPELPAEVKQRMDDSSAAFEQAKKMSDARTQAFNKRVELDRAAQEARREAWRASQPQRGSFAPFEAPAAPAAE
jgi:hypothetical protein